MATATGRWLDRGCAICRGPNRRPEETQLSLCPACMLIVLCLHQQAQGMMIDPAEFGATEQEIAVVMAALAGDV